MKIYVDTCVFGGFFDEEFRDDARYFFEKIDEIGAVINVNYVTVDEISSAPEDVRNFFYQIKGIEEIVVTTEMRLLADRYIKKGVVRPTDYPDALHIATATVGGSDIIASFNFKHIIRRSLAYNLVNLQCGHRTINIMAPDKVNINKL